MSPDPSSVPSLPSPRGSGTSWPTFAVSDTERRALSNGSVSQVKLGLSTPVAPARPGPPVQPPISVPPRAGPSIKRSYGPGDAKVTVVGNGAAPATATPAATTPPHRPIPVPVPAPPTTPRTVRSAGHQGSAAPAAAVTPSPVHAAAYVPHVSPPIARVATVSPQRGWFASRTADQLARAALVLSLFSLLLWIVAGAPAIVFGVLALGRTPTQHARREATAAIVLAVLIMLVEACLLFTRG